MFQKQWISRNVISNVGAVMEGCNEGWVLHHQVARNHPDTGTKVDHNISNLHALLLAAN